MSVHLQSLLDQADDYDRDDGRQAYIRYHDMMIDIASHYDCPVDRVVAAFVALSPTNDYHNNLRGLVTMLKARADGIDPCTVNVGTYKHCRDRAALYLDGVPFLSHAKGQKTRNFYTNILDPTNMDAVTIDGHMYWAWAGGSGTMREAKVTPGAYEGIAHDVRALAHCHRMIPHQMQATLWFTRKRVNRVVYSPQLSLLDIGTGAQKTLFRVADIQPIAQENDDER